MTVTITIFLILVGTFIMRVGALWTNVPNWLVARDRCGLITGFAIAVTAFAVVSLPL